MKIMLLISLIGIGQSVMAKSGFFRGEIYFEHMKNVEKCQLCHDVRQVKTLHLLTGQKISEAEIPVLCGQCHGMVKRAWDQGTHGKRLGSWRPEASTQTTCIKCHNPHSPKFPQMKAAPAPQRPNLGIPKHSHPEGDKL